MKKRINKSLAVGMYLRSIQVFLTIMLFMASLLPVNGQDKSIVENGADEELIRQYIQSKGSDIIFFDASNIKQYWIDHTVIAQKDSFDVILKNNNESNLLKIQLANVNETQNCSVEVLSETSNVSFSIFDNNANKFSDSVDNKQFLKYNLLSADFSLDKTILEDSSYGFQLKFNSPVTNKINLKAIILSFSKNEKSSFLSSPGKLNIGLNEVLDTNKLFSGDDNSIIVSKCQFKQIATKKSFYISNNPVSYSVKVKNTGTENMAVYLSLIPYTKDHKKLGTENFPYKGSNQILKVVSGEKGGKSIIVDRKPEWKANCSIAINAKEDMSDLPNFSLLDALIVEIKETDDGKAEIVLDKALTKELNVGETIRIHGDPKGLHEIHMVSKAVGPGEEVECQAIVQKKASLFAISKEGFPEGAYYFKPLLTLAGKDMSVLIHDHELDY